MTAVPRSEAVQKARFRWSTAISGGVDRENAGPPDKTAGQSTWSTGPSLKGVCGCEVEPHHTPLKGAADHEPPEPTDEDIWLAGVASQVEADARPLFAATWIWLLERALEADEEQPA